jgi:hypothetical protein
MMMMMMMGAAEKGRIRGGEVTMKVVIQKGGTGRREGTPLPRGGGAVEIGKRVSPLLPLAPPLDLDLDLDHDPGHALPLDHDLDLALPPLVGVKERERRRTGAERGGGGTIVIASLDPLRPLAGREAGIETGGERGRGQKAPVVEVVEVAVEVGKVSV